MRKRDLTQGNIASNLLYMAVPTMFASLAQTLYDIVDMIWIGRISAQAVASITIFATIFWAAFILNDIVGQGSVALISQSYGSGDHERTNRVVEQAIAFKVVLALMAGAIIILFINPLMAFFSKDPEVIAGAVAYGRIRTLFLPLMFASFSCRSALRCSGDSKSPMYIAIFVSIINIVLDPIFIFETVPFIGIQGLNMGITGAAWATGVANLTALSLGSWILFTGKSRVQPTIKGLFRLNPEINRKFLAIGMPIGINSFLQNVASILMVKMVGVFGTAAIASMGIVNRLRNFTFMPIRGLQSGGSTIIGQCLGKEDVPRASKTARMTMLLGSIVMSIFAMMFIFIPRQLIGIFVQDPTVLQYGAMTLRIFAPSVFLIGLKVGCNSAFSGSGYTLPFLISGFLGRWGVQIPGMALTVYVFKLPYAYVVATYLLAAIVEFLVMMYAYRKGEWQNTRAQKATNLSWKTIKQFFAPIKKRDQAEAA